MIPAAARWAQGMAEWVVPQRILDAAPARPYVFSPEMFAAPPAGAERSRRAREGGVLVPAAVPAAGA